MNMNILIKAFPLFISLLVYSKGVEKQIHKLYYIGIGVHRSLLFKALIAWLWGLKRSLYSVSRPPCTAGRSLDLAKHPWVRDYSGFLF